MKRYYSYWVLLLVAAFLFPQCRQAPEEKTAKYVFYFIGDGMGVNQVNGTEMFLAEKEGRIGVEPLCFTEFPVENLMTTYSRYHAVTCSAAAGTAMACGEKTRNGIIGMDSLGQRPLRSIASRAKDAGRHVGILTTVSVDHATPAAFYAHQPDRAMYYEIATDMAVAGFDFYAGGGFLEPVNGEQPGAPSVYEILQDSGYVLLRNPQTPAGKAAGTDRVVWIQEEGAVPDALPYQIDRTAGCMTLAQMTEAAIDFLAKDGKGFFLMAEGGKIDWAAHNNDAATVFREVEDFSAAVQEAIDFYRQHPDETLIVVTADHETGGLIPGNGVTKLQLKVLENQQASMEMMTAEVLRLRKAKGNRAPWADVKALLERNLGFWKSVPLTPGQEQELKAVYDRTFDGSPVELERSLYAANEPIVAKAVEILNDIAGLSWASGEHSASLVPVYALGAGAEHFTGKLDNTDLPSRIARAMGLTLSE